ncbi:DPP4 [Branchiostoma lanceolatum]|uniref:DPP4 protein n=1 Tax=Branchiostoma lanceolatum TaxID=7740 RepID=A0A8J9Z8M1_BRALA|nr:DPP4 [Branchiostoma lanceolatum]
MYFSRMTQEASVYPEEQESFLGPPSSTPAKLATRKALLVTLGVIVLIAAITAAITVPLLLLYGGGSGTPDDRPGYTFEDMFNQKFSYKGFSARWISEEDYLYRDEDGAVLMKNVRTNDTTVLMDNSTFTEYDAFDYKVSPDRQYILLTYNYRKVFRHSFTANCLIYDVQGSAVTAWIPYDDVQYASWAPVGHKLVFVYKNNMYLKTDFSGNDSQPITTDGVEGLIWNGIPDWVYEEEVFGANYAMWWSSDGNLLAFAKFNDTQVPVMSFSHYGETQYPMIMDIHYPKAGRTNPSVSLHVVDTTDPTYAIREVPAPEGLGDLYLYIVSWASNSQLYANWVPRPQNTSIVNICDVTQAPITCRMIEYEESTTGWIGVFGPSYPTFIADGSSYLIIQPHDEGSGAGKYRHLCLRTITQSGEASREWLTTGQFEVTSIQSYDEANGIVYFISNEEIPRQRHLYSLTVSQQDSKKCLTCGLWDDCGYYSAYFSKNASWYILSCRGPGVPIYTLNEARTDNYVLLEFNDELRTKMDETRMPVKRYQQFRVSGYDGWAEMFLPPDFDETKKYPVLFDVYAGPYSQKVNEQFRLYWTAYLASSLGIIVASFDGRGSGYRGEKLLHEIYRRMGTVEVEDQIEAGRQFQNLEYVDKDKMAIWGWSYGGFVTSHVIGRGSDVFKCGIAVAPVTDYLYYDSVYTERYMQHPQDNEKGYNDTIVMHQVENFKKAKFLLVHGTGDDNVHFQHTADLVDALTRAEAEFDLMIYTDQDHSIRTTRKHLYNKMNNFLKECFDM